MFDHFFTASVDPEIQPGAQIGLRYREDAKAVSFGGAATIRSGTVIYGDVSIGENFQTGHHALIREHTVIGNHVVVGTHSIIDGHTRIGDFVKIESRCYIPPTTEIGDRVFFGPGVIITNDKYPLRQRKDYAPSGPVIEDDVTLGAGCIICPGVRIGKGSMVAAGAIVTKDILPWSLVMGHAGKMKILPNKLKEPNWSKSWESHLHELEVK